MSDQFAVPPVQGEATVSTRSGFINNAGRWATEQFVRAMREGRPLNAQALRTNAVLPREAWIQYDRAVVEGALPRMRAVGDLVAAGLTTPLPNAMGTTVYGYDTMGDMDPAMTSMDGLAKTENDTIEFGNRLAPVPIIHKDFFIHLRKLEASRRSGQPLDTTQANIAGRKCGEEAERTLVIGGKTFAGLPLYGYTTTPFRITRSFGAGGVWTGAATGEQITADILLGVQDLNAQGFYGPFWLYVPGNMSAKLEGDYKAAATTSIRQRILDLEPISDVRYLDQLPAGNVLIVQPTADVITMLDGEALQSIQWDMAGGFVINYKSFMIQVPLIRGNAAGKTGILHMA
jgi:hypothetical protein